MSDIKEIRAKLTAQDANSARNDQAMPAGGWLATLVFVGLIAWGSGSLVNWLIGDRPPSAAPSRAAKKAEKPLEPVVENAPPKLDRFHCLSAWDGTYSALINVVKENLRDPGSFEHVETRISEIAEDGRQDVIMRYRAKNGFGGVNVQYAKGRLFNLNCALEQWKG
jgi:hypothetical protein